MSIGWYLDADGVIHTFHAIDGWTQWSLHDGGEIPSDDFLLGIVDGELLSWALRRVAELGEPSQVHVGLRMNGESITICAISGGSDGGRRTHLDVKVKPPPPSIRRRVTVALPSWTLVCPGRPTTRALPPLPRRLKVC